MLLQSYFSIALIVVALERWPQPGGVVHPPNPRGWLLGEVQAITQIFSSSKNTRTLEDLEWFGPPERNTLRSLRVINKANMSNDVAP